MPDPTQNDVFAEVLTSLMKELCAIPYSTDTIIRFLANNNSPVLAEIQYLSLSKLNINQIDTLLPILAKMTGLTSLAFSGCSFSPNHLKFLFTECSALSNIQSLDFSEVSGVMSEDLQLLSQSTTITNLTSLNLSGCRDVTTSSTAAVPAKFNQREREDDWEPVKGSSGLVALLSSPVLKNLTHLNLGSTLASDPLIHSTIATSPHLSNLVSLDLSSNKINSDAVAALATSTTLTNLTHLNLFDTALGDKLIAQLLSPPSLLANKLQSLNLGGTNITVSSLEVVLNASPHLTEIYLGGNEKLGPAGAIFIAQHMPNLSTLNLSGCRLSHLGYAALAASNTLTNLRKLNLRANGVPAQSIVALVNSPVMANLTHLDLGLTHRGPEVLTAIAQSAAMSKLEHLSFCDNDAGNDAVIAFAQSTTLKNLTWLDLSNNRIGPTGVNALCTSPVVSKLTRLDLHRNGDAGNAIAAALAAPSSTLYCLIELGLLSVRIGDKGVLQLLATPYLDQLNVLVLRGNPISGLTKDLYRTRFDSHIY